MEISYGENISYCATGNVGKYVIKYSLKNGDEVVDTSINEEKW